jgi:hypothetical protein
LADASRPEGAAARFLILARIAVATACEQDGEIELFVIGIEAHEQVEHFVQHFLRAAVGTVDLVDDDDRLEAQRQRLAGDELGLRHRPFGAVDQQDHPVDHAENAFHLGAEVGVAGGVDDVDAGGIAAAFRRPFDAGALGENGDPAFLFEIARIHRAFFHPLVVAESAGLAEKLVHQRGFAVVNVGDDRDISQRGGHFFGFPVRSRAQPIRAGQKHGARPGARSRPGLWRVGDRPRRYGMVPRARCLLRCNIAAPPSARASDGQASGRRHCFARG